MLNQESGMSVFELLWNIAVSMLILRISLIYYGLTFLTGCILGLIRLGILTPVYDFRQPIAELIEMPFLLLAVVFWARFVVSKFDIPNIAWLRLAIGLLALVFMLLTELVGGRMAIRESWTDSMPKTVILAKSSFAISLVIFGLMPWLVMVVQDERIEWEKSRFLRILRT
jgi:hypothetical protein